MITYDRYAFILACIGTLTLVYHAASAIDRFGDWLHRWRFERRLQRQPSMPVTPLLNVQRAAVTRKKGVLS